MSVVSPLAWDRSGKGPMNALLARYTRWILGAFKLTVESRLPVTERLSKQGVESDRSPENALFARFRFVKL